MEVQVEKEKWNISCKLFMNEKNIIEIIQCLISKKGRIVMNAEMMKNTNLYTTFTSNYNWLLNFSYSNLRYSTDGGNKFVCRVS